MKSKFIIFITVIVTILCLFYLSFSFVSLHIQNKAIKYATDESGNIDFDKKQKYLESLHKKGVYKFLFYNYTYEEIKERELSLGLDLLGGMNITLEIDTVELLKNLSGNNQEAVFLETLKELENTDRNKNNIPTIDLFYQLFKKRNPDVKLSTIFATLANKSKIKYNSPDQEIIKFLKKEEQFAIDRSLYIIRNRIDPYGTSQTNIQKLPGSGRIQVELPGMNNPARIRKLLQSVAKLSFWSVYNYEDLEPYFEKIDNKIIKEQHDQNKNTERKIFNSPFNPKKGRYMYSTDEKKEAEKLLLNGDISSMFPRDVRFCWSYKPSKIDNEEFFTLYPIQKSKFGKKALLEGDVVTDAQQSFEPGTNNVTVSMQMNSKGAREWKKITKNNIGKQIAIILDDKVYSAPVVRSEIPNGSSAISGNFTLQEAQDLANTLKTGSFPTKVKIVEEVTVGPTLGKKAQIQGMASMIVGLALVIVFMIMYYAKGGFVANFALLFNMLFIMGTLAQLHASSTLPGIAGIVLTIGMSIDANVLIFERIREELKNGLHIKEAVSIGYKKAYSSIIDSNLTTFLTGVILYWMGTGPVKGFATTMMIGIISSFFSAVFITRVIFEKMLSKNKKLNLSFSFPYSKNLLSNINLDFMKMRKFSYAISIIIIGLGFILLFFQKGLNLGVDFTGGRSYIINFKKYIDPTELKSKLMANYFNHQGTEVKTYGSNTTLKVTTSFQINDDSSAADKNVKNLLIEGIEKITELKYSEKNQNSQDEFTIDSSTKIGATVANDIKSSSKKSILLSLIMIFLYILMRFRKWQFGLASVLALLHDSLVVISAFTIARLFGFSYEVDQVFIAAILTVIGYSINDTVVVFDRIRENLHLKGKNITFKSIANKSINETMTRTLITSFTTFIAVFILFIFGGEALRGFSFAMLVGIIFGTYSSIFIATPLAIDLDRKSLV